jgi:uncharacterized membrane protein YczE
MKITRFLFFMIGIAILTFGASLTLKASLGAGPWDALAAGQAKASGFTVGTWVIINGLVLLFINAYLMQKQPQYFAIITFFLIGTMIDFWLLKVLKEYNPQDLVHRASVLMLGIVLIAIGVTMYLHSHFPINPIDHFMVAIHTKFGVSLMAAKTMAEMFALVFAILLKGPIGIGTLIVAFTIGPIIQFFYGPVERFMHKVGSLLR